MKRRLFKLGVFLLAGAIVNVAVAWSCALWSGPLQSSRYFMLQNVSPAFDEDKAHLEELGWRKIAAQDFFDTKIYQSTTTCSGLTRRELLESSLPYEKDPIYQNGVYRECPAERQFFAGWPARSMVGEMWNGGTGATWLNPTWNYRQSLPPWNSQTRFVAERLIPLKPIWLGFALDAMFDASILWLLFMSFQLARRMRRHMRLKRGLCPACKYPIGASPTCTECGTALVLHKKPSAQSAIKPPATNH